jgi:hypothetical protein
LTILTGIITISFFFLIAQAEINGKSIENIELYSKITKDDNDNSNQPTIIQQEEKDTLSKNTSIYDGLNIS